VKIWLWLVLTLLTLTAGCARGYYDSRPAYQGGATVNWYQNPETEGEYEMRLWQEDAGSH
jgi:hypothetical protein